MKGGLNVGRLKVRIFNLRPFLLQPRTLRNLQPSNPQPSTLVSTLKNLQPLKTFLLVPQWCFCSWLWVSGLAQDTRGLALGCWRQKNCVGLAWSHQTSSWFFGLLSQLVFYPFVRHRQVSLMALQSFQFTVLLRPLLLGINCPGINT